MKKFAAGMIAGVALTAVTAYAAGFRHWNRGEIEAANELFHARSGLHFTVDEPPPDPDRVQTLTVHAHAVDEIAQDIAVRGRATDATIPPGPCFVAHLTPPGPPVIPPGPCRVGGTCPSIEVLHPDQFTIVGADGTPLALCPVDPNGGGTTPP
jgi:hypothetical protein